MTPTDDFNLLAAQHGSSVRYHREDGVVLCPCLTPEGFRDPIWHVENPSEPVCNAAGLLPQPGTTADFIIKGWVQPVQSGAVRRLTTEQILNLFGEVNSDDHLGLFPCRWNAQQLNFYDWGSAAEDWIEYNNRKYTVVSVNLIADPETGDPFHHWEVGLRLIES